MMMDDSSVLGMAFGSAGVTRVLMCVAINCRSGCCSRNWLSCSSKAVAGDLPEGSLWRTTSNIFAFISHLRINPAFGHLILPIPQHFHEHPEQPGLRLLWFRLCGWIQLSRVVLQFLMAVRTGVRIAEIAESNTAVGTF